MIAEIINIITIAIFLFFFKKSFLINPNLTKSGSKIGNWNANAIIKIKWKKVEIYSLIFNIGVATFEPNIKNCIKFGSKK